MLLGDKHVYVSAKKKIFDMTWHIKRSRKVLKDLTFF